MVESSGTTVRVSRETHRKLILIRDAHAKACSITTRISMGAVIEFLCYQELEYLED